MTVSTPLEERFWKYVDKRGDDECWEWKAYIHPSGYGTIARGRSPVKMLQAHRVSWEIHFGKIPDRMLVCHTCDNRICVNPTHLFLGTPKDNTSDRDRKGRGKIPVNRGERHRNSKLSKSDVLLIRDITNINGTHFSVCKSLSKRFGVSRATIYDISKYRTWKHI